MNAPKTRRERFYGWLAGKMILRSGRMALARGDRHEFLHAVAALRVGATDGDSHATACPAEMHCADLVLPPTHGATPR